MLGTLRAELEVAMILTGCRTIRSAGRHLIDAD
jgi:isopentenyl diphosphate isomerase/L-lactate dehydrogenase-like FMN-dependent dehydrogenase